MHIALVLCRKTVDALKQGEQDKLSREIMQKFKEKNSTTTCKVLKGVETGKLLRTCPDCIRDAAAIVEEVLFSEE